MHALSSLWCQNAFSIFATVHVCEAHVSRYSRTLVDRIRMFPGRKYLYKTSVFFRKAWRQLRWHFVETQERNCNCLNLSLFIITVFLGFHCTIALWVGDRRLWSFLFKAFHLWWWSRLPSAAKEVLLGGAELPPKRHYTAWFEERNTQLIFTFALQHILRAVVYSSPELVVDEFGNNCATT